jgi:hypothetical protein
MPQTAHVRARAQVQATHPRAAAWKSRTAPRTQVPGPGHYDCEHVFGLARRIALASPARSTRPAGAALGPTVRLGPDGAIRPHSTPPHPLLGGVGRRGAGGGGRGGGGGDGGGDGGELVLVLDPVRHEQRLVMSSRVPARSVPAASLSDSPLESGLLKGDLRARFRVSIRVEQMAGI